MATQATQLRSCMSTMPLTSLSEAAPPPLAAAEAGPSDFGRMGLSMRLRGGGSPGKPTAL